MGVGQKWANPKMACPGKWKQGLKTCGPCWLNLDRHILVNWVNLDLISTGQRWGLGDMDSDT